jgi:hypothetical protein
MMGRILSNPDRVCWRPMRSVLVVRAALVAAFLGAFVALGVLLAGDPPPPPADAFALGKPPDLCRYRTCTRAAEGSAPVRFRGDAGVQRELFPLCAAHAAEARATGEKGGRPPAGILLRLPLALLLALLLEAPIGLHLARAAREGRVADWLPEGLQPPAHALLDRLMRRGGKPTMGA